MPKQKDEQAENPESPPKTSNEPPKVYPDFLGATKDFSETTSKVVQQAAEILESEIAMGIRAAKKVEEQYTKSDKLRGENPNDVMLRFRRDAHEVIDIFVDVADAALKHMNNISDVVVMKQVSPEGKIVRSTSVQSTVTAPQSIKAGEKAEITLSFENNADTATDEFKLYSTDLVGESGMRISSGNVKFFPADFRIGPHEQGKVTVIVNVPEGTKPGIYCGLLLAINMNQIRSEIVIKVE